MSTTNNNKQVYIMGEVFPIDEAMSLLQVDNMMELIKIMRTDDNICFYNDSIIKPQQQQEEQETSNNTTSSKTINEEDLIEDEPINTNIVMHFNNYTKQELAFFITHLQVSDVADHKYIINDMNGTITFLGDSLSMNDKSILQDIESKMKKEFRSINGITKLVARSISSTIFGTAGRLTENAIAIGGIISEVAYDETNRTIRRSKVNLSNTMTQINLQNQINKNSTGTNDSIFN